MTAATASELAEHRRVLVGLGYRMLGSIADAEDAAQEALLRLHQTDPPPENPRAWLVRVTTRLCIDRLRQARRRRETYVGPWLPDFLLEEAEPADEVARAESLTLALLVLLESLSPAERAAFVLHDVFGYGYPELSDILERGEAACRQLVSRARRQLEHRRPRFEPDPERRAAVAYAFMQAASEGEMKPLLALLADDVVLRSDANGTRPAPRQPLQGARLVAKFVLGLRQKYTRDARFTLTTVNGTPGFIVHIPGEPETIYGFDVTGGRICAVHVLREPGKVRAALARRASS
jgi:RNA polymerase sigma-70 factor (ECF subfamily)